MKNREIRPITPSDMTAYINIYLNAYPAGKDLSSDCYDKYYSRNMQSLLEFDHVNFFGMFEEGELIAIMKLIDFDMNLFGEMRKATGLMSLGVHPLHKKKGAARDMVRFFEEYTVKSGGTVSLLLPFRMDFYRKLGYGCGTRLDEYHIRTEYLPEERDMEGLRFMSKEDVDNMVLCHTDFVSRYHGALCKFEEEIRDMKNDDDVRRLGYFEGAELLGYVTFAFVNTSDCNYTLNLMDVKEIVYKDEKVLRKLLGGLRMQSDLAQSVIIRSGEADFYHLLESAQDMSGNYIDFGFLQTNISAVGTMYKIPDIEAFIKAAEHRKFPAEKVSIAFTVLDELCGDEKKFVLKFRPEEGLDYSRWSYSSSEEDWNAADVHLSCKLSELSSMLMGSAELGGLARLGVVEIDKPEKVRLLDYLFHAEQKPFTNTDY